MGLLKNLQQRRINHISKKFYNTTLTEIDEENMFAAIDNRYFKKTSQAHNNSELMTLVLQFRPLCK